MLGEVFVLHCAKKDLFEDFDICQILLTSGLLLFFGG